MKRLLPLFIFTILISLSPLISNSQCIADFSVSNTSCTNGAITFTDLSSTSTSSIAKEIWDFGTGNIDTISGVPPTGMRTYNYFLNGNYTVKLTVITVSGCTSIVSKNINVTIKPQVSFTVGPQVSDCGFITISYNNGSAISTGDSLSLLWKFSDDATTATSNSYTKKYYNHGTFGTWLKVTAANGCADSLGKSITITEIPKASFKVNNKSICVSDTASMSITLQSSSSSSYFLRKVWYFGDGTNYIDGSLAYTTVKHKYNAPGKYIVTLLYQTSKCNIYYYDSVEVREAAFPAFSSAPEAVGVCGYQKMNFINQSIIPTGFNTQYKWTFNNSIIDTSINPSFIYRVNGSYSVKLTITETGGCKTTLDTSINVNGIDPKPIAKFNYETDTLNLLRYNFYDSSFIDPNRAITTNIWDFGDGNTSNSIGNASYTFLQKGSYWVQRQLVSNTGCADTAKKLIVVDSLPVALCNPLFFAPANVCVGTISTFNDSSYLKNGSDSLIKQIWDFGDGIRDTIYSNFYYAHYHKYEAPGIYYVSLTIFTKRGCSNTLTRTATVRSLKSNVDFSYTQIPNCSETTQAIQYNVTNYSVGNLSTKWIFGDGNSTTGAYDFLQYYAPGYYTAKFLSRISGCQSTYDTLSKNIAVLAKSKSDFIYAVDEQDSKTIQFTDKSYSGFNNIQSLTWDFGDGTSSTERNPKHTFATYGIYKVKLSFVSELSSCVPDTVAYDIQIDSFKLLPVNISQSNMGTEFWAGYGYIENMRRNATNTSRPHLSIYLSASENPATVLVDIPNMPITKKTNSGFPKVVYVPANSVVEVKDFPIGDPNDIYNAKNLADTRLYFTGITDRAIRITSNQPIGAWEHVYATNNTAGGTLLLPTKMWSTSYLVQSIGGKANSNNPNSYFFVIAESDSTIIEFTPSNDILDSSAATIFTENHTTANVKYKAGITYKLLLNKGEVFNAMGFIQGAGQNVATALDLTGTKVISTNPFKKIAVFGGNGRVIINTTGCTNATGSDNLIQQMFPKAVWGTKYLTAPTKTMENGVYRITVDDPTTVVSVNEIPLSPFSIINNRYYEITRNQPLKIESDKRVMVTQYVVTPGCPSATTGNNGTGDPELINLTPLKYGIKNVSIFSPTFKTISVGASASYLNIIIRKEGLNSLLIDNSNMVDTGTSSFVAGGAYGSSPLVSILDGFKTHPGDTNYAYAKIKVATGSTHTIASDSSFLAIAYGMTNGETIGYNAGFNFNSIPIRYQFLGNGDWTNPINWLGNKIPPAILPMGSEIIISGNCTMDVPQTIEDGARIVVETGGRLTVNGNLIIQQ